eukprot:scaffold16490_cov73-Phaeocystis_antarctica.AAC.4
MQTCAQTNTQDRLSRVRPNQTDRQTSGGKEARTSNYDATTITSNLVLLYYIALRSPASERPSDLNRYSPDIHSTISLTTHINSTDTNRGNHGTMLVF